LAQYIGAIDQGTSSTRFMVFDRKGAAVAVAQKEHRQIYPQPGWVEHDPAEIVARTREVVAEAMERGGLVAGCFTGLADLRGNWPAVPLAGWLIWAAGF
jgi:glycerol kinase